MDITVLYQCVCKHHTTMKQVIIMVMQSFKNQSKKSTFSIATMTRLGKVS